MKNIIYKPSKSPKILALDIETAPIEGFVWGLFENNVSLNQIKQDWTILSWSAKWIGDPASKIMYQDQRKARNVRDDKRLLKDIWTLLDQCDIVLSQNGISFDLKKLNARFILNGFKPPSSYRHIDTKRIASKKFAFTSNKLEYMTSKLCKKFKKLKHKKFPGFELWSECLKGNQKAWQEMELYNKYDVLALEELYKKLRPWDSSINFSSITGVPSHMQCACGSRQITKWGFRYTVSGKFQRYKCSECGTELLDKKNLLTKKRSPKDAR